MILANTDVNGAQYTPNALIYFLMKYIAGQQARNDTLRGDSCHPPWLHMMLEIHASTEWLRDMLTFW
jgi:hypothetical protein